tara:strand:+ start:5657 stop:6286 length:630 start_codon:yes stop_codon:yes gene_type:complete
MSTAPQSLKVLRIDASMRRAGSVSRDLADDVIASLRARHGEIDVTERNLADGVPLIDEAWIGANFTDPADRTDEQKAALALSDTLVRELKEADAVVIATPIYNFSVPGALKAWIDQIARARETFRYSEAGPVGLLEGKKAYLVIASGGTEIGGEIDFASGYVRHILGFIGIDDVTTVAAGRLMFTPEESVASAKAEIAAIGAAVQTIAA